MRLKTWPPIKILRIIVYVLLINITVIILSPILLSITAIFLLLRTSIDIYLRIKHGKIYGGLLCSPDSVWHSENPNYGMINVVAIFTSNSTNSYDFLHDAKVSMQKKVFDHPDQYPKYTSIKEDCQGYGYLLGNQASLDECFYMYSGMDNFSNEYIDEKYLKKIINDLAEKPLDTKALWEFIVIPKPVKWNDNLKNCTQHAVLFRFSHCFGDGFTIIAALLGTFAKDKTLYVKSFDEMVNKIRPKTRKNLSIYQKFSRLLKKIGIFLFHTFVFAPQAVYQSLIKEEVTHSLHAPALTGKRHLIFVVEKEEGMIDVIKDTKKHLPDASFSSIVLTGLSASLYQYYQKISETPPKYMSMTVTVQMQKPKMDTNKQKNTFSTATLKLPIDAGITLPYRFRRVKKALNSFSKSPEFFVNDVFLRYLFGIFPSFLVHFLMKLPVFIGIISIVPCLKEKVRGDKFSIEDVVFFLPQIEKAGFNMSCLTYRGRFQFGISVDQLLIPDANDVQIMADSIMENIRQLHRDVTPMTSSSFSDDVIVTVL